jgi:hypothetical protein
MKKAAVVKAAAVDAQASSTINIRVIASALRKPK